MFKHASITLQPYLYNDNDNDNDNEIILLT